MLSAQALTLWAKSSRAVLMMLGLVGRLRKLCQRLACAETSQAREVTHAGISI